MTPTIVVAGPTASGKSDLALKIAKHIGGIIINADSRQIYKEFPIATAQPTPDNIDNNGIWEIQQIKHYLYGIRSILNHYDIYQYNQDLKKVIEETPTQNHILTGGTGLYIDSFIYNYDLTQKSNSDYSREYLLELSKEDLKKILGDKIEKLNESDRENPVRLIREIERGESTNLEKNGPIRECIYLYLDVDATDLERNIKTRIDKMLDLGLEKEASLYFEMKNSKELPKVIGLDEFGDYFKKLISIEEVKNLIYLHTRQYAKRQRTWFARNKEMIKVRDFDEAIKDVETRISRNS